MNSKRFSMVGVAVLSLILQAKAGLVLNGDFEQPDLGGPGANYGVGSTTVAGWTVVGSGGVTIHHVNQIDLLWPGNNSQFMDLTGNTGRAGVESAPITTVPGQTYSVTFDAVNGSRWWNAGTKNPYYGPALTLQASGGALVTYSSAADLPPGSIPVPPAGNLVPVSLSYNFVATGTATTLTFMDASGYDSNAGWIDNVMIAPVPEPSTIVAGVLLLVPFAVQVLRTVRRNRAA